MATMKELSVVAAGAGLTRMELVKLKQEHGESFWLFTFRVCSKAEMCLHTTTD